MQIIRYGYSGDIDIKFLDEHGAILRNYTYQNFARGTVKNPYDKSVYGVGCVGDGKHLTKINGVFSRTYGTWTDMLRRCYYDKRTYPTYYQQCNVCDEWHNFQNFADWYESNKYKVNERLHLDKDILVKGNKTYSPDTCVLVPQRINMLFMDVTSRKIHDKELPQGIRKSELQDGRIRYHAMCCGKSIGTFDTLQEATDKYFEKKREHIREVADEYKDIIPAKVYNALLNW